MLLHFNYTTKPYAATGSLSIAEVVLKDLKQIMPKYNKAHKEVFSVLSEQLDFAKANAIRGLKETKKNHTDNPSTLIYELVAYLQEIKSK